MISPRDNGLFLAGFVLLLALAQPVAAFGAGNIASISKVEGQNWRHGDIEDVLLTLSMARAMRGQKFNKLNVSRVYFGNWLRDYSQAIDMGTVKMVSAEAIRLLLCVLGFMTFGYGSGEFEVTAERLGCYRPEEHIDNPKGYGEGEDPRDYHRALRGPIDERRELSVDPETGMKNYIANENAGITTSSAHIKNLLRSTVELTRRYNRSKRDEDFYEALRLMGTGLHCLEDFYAHSNYCELALIEIGEKDVFSHCGRRTQIRLEGAREPVYPIVTGTFGGVDFLHSVTGEVSDKLTQNEIDELQDTLSASQKADTSLLRDLLDKIPDGIFGGKHESDRIDELQENANNAQVQNMSVSPREPEEFTRYVQNLFKQVMPAIEFHDEVMKNLTAAIEKIPVLPKILEQLEEHLTVFVFSLIAPMLLPLINQIKNELKTGSEQIIESSENEQLVVFNDDSSDNPTHSMLSKDHFSNILNELAGQCSAKMLHWAVPQLMDAIDDENADVERVLDDIVNGVLHHPAQRDNGRGKAHEGRRQIYQVVKEWWREMSDERRDDYRRRLSRDGVRNQRNHKDGVQDTGHGHGCAGKLKMQKLYGQPTTLEDKIAGHAADAIFKGATGLISEAIGSNGGSGKKDEGGLGGLLGAAGSLLGGAFGKDEKKHESSGGRNDDGSYTRTEHETGRHGDHYAEATVSHTSYPGGGEAASYHSSHQQASSGGGYSSSSYSRTETRPESGSYARTEQHSSTTHGYGSSGGDYGSSGRSGYGHSSEHREESHTSGGYGSSDRYRKKKDDDDDSEDSSSSKKKYKKEKKEKKERRKSRDSKKSEDSDDERRGHHGSSYQSGGYGGSSGRDDEDRRGGYGSSGHHGSSHQQSYGSGGRDNYSGSTSGGYGGSHRRDDDRPSGYGSSGHQSGGYGREEQSSYGGHHQQSGYGREEQSSYGGHHQQSGYGRQEQPSYTGSSGGYGNQQQPSYGVPGGFPGQQQESQYGSSGGYGERRDEHQAYGRDNDRGSYGQGGYGGNSGYGDSSGYGSGGYGGSDRRY